jgi:uncharacterized protein YdeI (BOF family)
MTDGVLYKKVGRKYVPHEFYQDGINYYRPGSYLVVIHDRGTSITSRVFADKIELQAQIRAKSDDITSMVNEQMSLKPAKKMLTKKQVIAWENFQKAMGDDKYCVQVDAIGDIVTKLEEILCGE